MVGQARSKRSSEPSHGRRDDWSVDQYCVLCGLLVITPERHQSALLLQLHEDHLNVHGIEFKYYADGIHSGLTPPG